jgi:hypothetical protein
LSIDHLRVLEQNMTEALNGVRGRKVCQMLDLIWGFFLIPKSDLGFLLILWTFINKNIN